MRGKNTVRAKKPNPPKSVGKEVNKKSTKKVVQQDAVQPSNSSELTPYEKLLEKVEKKRKAGVTNSKNLQNKKTKLTEQEIEVENSENTEVQTTFEEDGNYMSMRVRTDEQR